MKFLECLLLQVCCCHWWLCLSVALYVSRLICLFVSVARLAWVFYLSLIDCNVLQVWNALELGQHLEAARLYLQAQDIMTGLQTDLKQTRSLSKNFLVSKYTFIMSHHHWTIASLYRRRFPSCKGSGHLLVSSRLLFFRYMLL